MGKVDLVPIKHGLSKQSRGGLGTAAVKSVRGHIDYNVRTQDDSTL
jgi:hypothetical protein